MEANICDKCAMQFSGCNATGKDLKYNDNLDIVECAKFEPGEEMVRAEMTKQQNIIFVSVMIIICIVAGSLWFWL